VGSSAFDRTSLGGRVANYFSFLLAAALAGFFIRRRDIIICGTDPPLTILVGVLVARGEPLVYAVQDLHPEATTASGLLRQESLLVRAWERVHRWALRRCTHIVCLGSGMARRIESKGIHPDLISVIRTGAGAPSAPVDPAVVDRLRGDEGLVIVHAGNIGTAGPWDEIATAAVTAVGVHFVFVGDGVAADDLRARGVDVQPFLPLADVSSVMAAGDLQMVALGAGLSNAVVPSKLYTALGHGRPIFAVVPEQSEVAEIVRHYNCGIVVEPHTEAIAEAATHLAKDTSQLEQLEANARRAALELSKERSLNDWISLVERLT